MVRPTKCSPETRLKYNSNRFEHLYRFCSINLYLCDIECIQRIGTRKLISFFICLARCGLVPGTVNLYCNRRRFEYWMLSVMVLMQILHHLGLKMRTRQKEDRSRHANYSVLIFPAAIHMLTISFHLYWQTDSRQHILFTCNPDDRKKIKCENPDPRLPIGDVCCNEMCCVALRIAIQPAEFIWR